MSSYTGLTLKGCQGIDLALVSGAHNFQCLQISIFVNIATFPASNKTCDIYLNNLPVCYAYIYLDTFFSADMASITVNNVSKS